MANEDLIPGMSIADPVDVIEQDRMLAGGLVDVMRTMDETTRRIFLAQFLATIRISAGVSLAKGLTHG